MSYRGQFVHRKSSNKLVLLLFKSGKLVNGSANISCTANQTAATPSHVTYTSGNSVNGSALGSRFSNWPQSLSKDVAPSPGTRIWCILISCSCLLPPHLLVPTEDKQLNLLETALIRRTVGTFFRGGWIHIWCFWSVCETTPVKRFCVGFFMEFWQWWSNKLSSELTLECVFIVPLQGHNTLVLYRTEHAINHTGKLSCWRHIRVDFSFELLKSHQCVFLSFCDMKLWNVTNVLAFYRFRQDDAEHSLPPHLCEQRARLRFILSFWCWFCWIADFKGQECFSFLTSVFAFLQINCFILYSEVS